MQFFFSYLRYGCRRALRQPGVTLSIIALLALGTGGVTAIFNPIYSTLFSPLSFPQPEQLVRIGGSIKLFDGNSSSFMHEEILDRVFSNVTVYSSEQTYIQIPGVEHKIDASGLIVNKHFFETLGVKPLIGTDCSNMHDRLGLVISHRFWRNELKKKADVVGTPVLLSNGIQQISIIGIMPENFNFPFDTDIWLCRSNVLWHGYNDYGRPVNFIGRLLPGMTYEQAIILLDSSNLVSKSKFPVWSEIFSDGPLLQSLQISIYGDQRPLLRMLGVAAILFLTLVCAGVVNLLITQGMKRKQEIATRLCYGATRRNLVFQLLVETLPLVVIGGLAGWWLSEIVSAWLWTTLPVLQGGVVDIPVKIAFFAALALVVTLASGLIPSLYATKIDLNTYLKSADGVKRRFFSSQEFLVGLQFCAALALLIGTGVLLRSIMFNIDIPIGWSSRDIAVVSVASPAITQGQESRYTVLTQDIQRELRAMPEVVSAEYLSPIPFSAAAVRVSNGLMMSVLSTPQGSGVVQKGSITAIEATVSADGFSILGIPFVAGRKFTEADIANWSSKRRNFSDGVVIINQALAQHLWPEENNVIGKEFINMNGPYYEVVGVVRNYHHVPGSRNFIPTIFFPHTGAYIGGPGGREIHVLVKLRANTPFQNFHTNVRQRLFGLSADWIEVQPLSERVKSVMASQRMTLQLLGCFTILGIIVSGLAVYAATSLMVTARKREIGIRMAMGAQTWEILKFVFLRGMRAILIGLPFGLFLAWILCKVLSSFLVYVNIGDLLVWGTSCTVLLVITIVAALIPALRAICINPLDAMRNE